MSAVSPRSRSLRSYWEERNNLPKELANSEVNFLDAVLEEFNPKSIAVFGCGTGRELGFTNTAHFYGVDFSKANVKQSYLRRSAHVVLAALQNLPFKEGKLFDLGICEKVLQHIPHEDIEAAAQEIMRLCRVLLLEEAVGCPEDFYQFSHNYERLFRQMQLVKKTAEGTNAWTHFFLFIHGDGK